MRTNAKWFLLAGCLAAVLGGEARGETREFDPYAGDFNLTNGEIVYPPADRLARVRLRDWMGKDLGSVTGVVLGTSFSIDAKNYFNGTVDYVTAFDGGTVAKASSDTYASGSKVTWKDIGDGLETEIFIQPRVPYPAEPRYGMADPWIVKDPKKNTWYSLITSGTSLKYRPNTSFPTADWGVTGGKGETTFFRFAEHPDEFGEYLQNCWAPEMHYIRGSWYIYTSLTRTKTDDTQRIHCLKLDGDDITSTTGWHLAKRFVTPGVDDSYANAWAIDATVLDDTDASGRMWLIWSGWPSVNNQNLYMAELATPTSFVANASRVLLSKPTESWELLNRKVNEGPVVLRHGNATHVVYSCNGCASDDYSLALLTCTNGNYGAASSWIKHGSRIFVSRKTAYGPGHCSFTKDAAGNEYVVYHAKYESGHTDSYWSYRDMRVQPIAWHGDFPVLGAPRPFEGTTDSFNANADYTKADADRRTVVHCPSSLIEAVEYTGSEQSPSWARYASVTVVSGGTRTEPGTNTVTLALADTTRYVWSDGTTANKTAKFAILPSAQAHEHAWGEWKTAVSPGCETDGYEVRVCTASGCTEPPVAETNVLAALDHDWGAWVMDVQPKIGVAGHRYRDCSRCDAHAEETIPPLSTEVTTNAMANAAWGYEIRGLGDDYLDVALVFTNATETTMTWTVPDGVTSFDFLVVGGGGSGGGNKSYYGAGGGGAGGVVTGCLAKVTGGDLFAVSVGAGGAKTAGGSNAGNKGKDSELKSGDRQIVAYGGGGGGKNAAAGSEGGSGGGSGNNGGNGGSATAGSVMGFGLEQRVANENGYFDAFGSKGGSCTANYAGAGGGGAGGVGGDGTSSTAAGKGGDGILCNLTGKNVRYAGGGGGGASFNNGKIGAGGAGGGGSGGGRESNVPKPGTDGLGGGGGGGGGASDTSVYSVGAAGGSGVVVVRYSTGDQPVPTHTHVWSEWTTNVVATCLTNGLATRVCTSAGCTEPPAAETNVLAALGHDWGAWVTDVEPQVGVAGHKYRDCTRCDAHEEETLAPLQPVPTEVTTNAMANGWGYEIRGLGAAMDEVALVFTNTTEEAMDYPLPDGATVLRYLVAAGGGAGGASSGNDYYQSGGGGAGGLLTASDLDMGQVARLIVSVGAGGAAVSVSGASAYKNGTNGGDSSLTLGTAEPIVAHGGGGGAGRGESAGNAGGSGGGAGVSYSTSAAAGSTILTAGVEGYAGGKSYKGQVGAGGGGGAGGAGGGYTDATKAQAGCAGGRGVTNDIAGVWAWFCAGGGGGAAGRGQVNVAGGAGGTGGGGAGARSGSTQWSANLTAGSGKNYGCGGGGAAGYPADSKDSVHTSGAGYQGVVIVRYRTGAAPQPTGKWDAVEAAQVDGVTDANKASVEATLDAIQAALRAGATAADVAGWLTTVYGNQKVAAATLANAKQVGISVKYDLPLLVSETPTVTVEASSDPVSETGVAAFVFTIMDGENAVPVTNAKVQAMVQYAATLAGGFAPSTPTEVGVTSDGTSFKAELKRVDGRNSGFMKVELK